MASPAHPENNSVKGPQTGERYEQAPEHAHSLLDSKDQRSIKNTLAEAEHVEKAQKKADAEEAPKPTDIAKSHGNEPSRGAKIDEQIEKEEAELLKQKGKA